MFTVGLGPVADSAFAISTMLIAVPTGIKIFNWIGTLWGGSISLNTPMLFSLGFIALFIIGGLSGVSHAAPPADAQQQDTYYVVAHLHYVLFGGSIFGIFSGIYYWFPKMTGRMLNDGLGKINFWLMFIGMNLTFAPMHWLGLDGMPRRIYTYDEGMGWNFCPNELGAKATREIVELVRNGSVRPVIGKLIDFEDIPREIQALFDRKTVGRTITKLY